MNEELNDIMRIITIIVDAKKRQRHYSSDEIKCTQYELAEKEYNKALLDEKDYYDLLIDKINKYIKYPKERFLFFDTTQKARLVHDGTFGQDVTFISIPEVDKQEYYCIIYAFKDCSYIKEWGWLGDRWIIKEN